VPRTDMGRRIQWIWPSLSSIRLAEAIPAMQAWAPHLEGEMCATVRKTTLCLRFGRPHLCFLST
jgi:hypothetical protein